MGLLDMLAPIINLLMLITYAVFTLFGLLICVVGVAYMSEIVGADKTAAGICIAAGLFMMLVGAAAVFATLKKNWLVMFIVLIIDVVLFVALLAACMVAYVIAHQVRDPVTHGVEEAFKTVELKKAGWAGVKESGSVVVCNEFATALALKVNTDKMAVAPAVQESEVAGNCTLASVRLGTPLGGTCASCWSQYQKFTIDKVKSHLWPATYTVFALFMFVVISCMLNIYMIDNCDPDDEDDDEDAADKWLPDGNVKLISLVLTAVVGLFGLLLMIFGIVAHSELSGDCAGKDSTVDCANWAVVGIIVLGTFFFLLSGLNVAAVILGGFIGKNIMRILTIVWVVLGFILLLVGIAFALVAGAISSINEEYDLNFSKVREQANQQDDTLCPVAMTDDACKAKLKKNTEDAFDTIAIILGITVAGFVFVLYVTLQAVKIFRADEDEDDEDGDE